MATDVSTYTPFEVNFKIVVLSLWLSKKAANTAEKSKIRETNSRGPTGYNRMFGHPPSSRQYWYLHRRNLLGTSKSAT
jgi:hypothetical protein